MMQGIQNHRNPHTNRNTNIMNMFPAVWLVLNARKHFIQILNANANVLDYRNAAKCSVT